MRIISIDQQGQEIKRKTEPTHAGMKDCVAFIHKQTHYMIGSTTFGTIRIFKFQSNYMKSPTDEEGEGLINVEQMIKEEEKPKHREGFSAVYAKGYIYVYGGTDTNQEDDTNKAYDQEIYRCNMNTKVWEKIQTCGVKPPPRKGAAMGYTPKQNKIWIYGGENEKGVMGDAYYLNLNDMTWEAIAYSHDAPYPKRTTGASIMYVEDGTPWKRAFEKTQSYAKLDGDQVMRVHSKIQDAFIIFGGLATEDESQKATQTHYSESLWLFDIEGAKWCEGLAKKTPSARAYATPVGIKDKAILYVFGQKKKGYIDNAYLLMREPQLQFVKIKLQKGKKTKIQGTRKPFVMIQPQEEAIYIYGGCNENERATPQLLKALIHPSDPIPFQKYISSHTMTWNVMEEAPQQGTTKMESDSEEEDMAKKSPPKLRKLRHSRQRSHSLPEPYRGITSPSSPKNATPPVSFGHARQDSFTFEDHEVYERETQPTKRKSILSLFSKKSKHARLVES